MSTAQIVSALASQRAALTPDAAALIEADGSRVTFSAIYAEAQALARGLAGLGLVRGDTISMRLPNWRETCAINLAASMLGLRLNPITPIYRSAELRAILADAGSRLIFIPHQFRSQDFTATLAEIRGQLPALEHVLTVRQGDEPQTSYEALVAAHGSGPDPTIEVAADDAKLLLYTSGTTGTAKGAIHTHASVHASLASSADYWSIGPSDRVLMASPVTHVTGYLFGLEMPFLTGSPALLMERWQARDAVDLIERERLTVMFGATPFLAELLDEAEARGRRLPSLRLFPCGGASVPPDLIRRAARVTQRCKAFRIFGATEVPMVTKGFVGDAEGDLAAETDGRVVGYEVKAVDAQGLAVPDGAEGELCVRGPGMFARYSSEEETAKAIDGQGFFRTGDLGVMHGDTLTVTGRLKDLIIRGGENLSPVEIENALARHPSVAEAAVVAMPHERLGEGVAAFLRCQPGAPEPTLAEVAAHLESLGLARQKFPEAIVVIEDFPRTASGKVRKDLLRERIKEEV